MDFPNTHRKTLYNINFILCEIFYYVYENMGGDGKKTQKKIFEKYIHKDDFSKIK